LEREEKNLELVYEDTTLPWNLEKAEEMILLNIDV
jgi:hypothetical protein